MIFICKSTKLFGALTLSLMIDLDVFMLIICKISGGILLNLTTMYILLLF